MELTLEQALQKGVEAHKAGKVKEADRYYTAILKANPEHPDANHNMGVLAVGVGKVEQALPFFKSAVEANPNIAQYWLSYIDALLKLDRPADAKAVFAQAKSKGAKGDGFDQIELQIKNYSVEVENQTQEDIPTQPNILDEFKLDKALKLAKKKAKDGLSEEAKKIYQDIIKKFPKNKKALDAMKTFTSKTLANTPDKGEPSGGQFQSLLNLYTQGQHQQALNEAYQLQKQFPNSINLYNIIGAANKDLGKLDEAIEAYNKTISIKPGYAEAHYNIGVTLREQGKLDEAIRAYKKALSIKPDYAEAYNNMGGTLQEQGKLDEAIHAYKKALTIKPNYVGAWSNGADALEKWNKLDQFELWLDKAFNSFDKVPADLRFMKSKLLWRSKKFEETSTLLSDIKLEAISESRRQDYLNLKANCFEKHKSFEKAYKCFAKSNSLAKKSSEYLNCDPDSYFQKLKDRLDKIRSYSHKRSKAQSTENSDFAPIFLVGFPRSGTTLLDTILRSNSKIKVVEEQGMLSAAERFLNKNGHDDFVGQIIPQKRGNEARQIYFKEFNKHIETSLNDSAYIDKLPLNLLKAPLIHQMYPDAKFILVLRHPMDTILSCWMQNFKLNAAMANMVDLDRLVGFYCIAMETFKICRTKYNLNVHEIRYEDLINNFRNESEAILHFLKLQWEHKMEKYADTALKRGRVNTPSYSQVVQPIYKDAQYRWLNYQEYLEQYVEQVKPWITEFGYN